MAWPPAASWITHDELLLTDMVFRDTVKELPQKNISVELNRLQGSPNFAPILLDNGYGVALGPLVLSLVGDEIFTGKLNNLA